MASCSDLLHSGDRLTKTKLTCSVEISSERKQRVSQSRSWPDQVGVKADRVKVDLKQKHTNTRQFSPDKPKCFLVIIPRGP